MAANKNSDKPIGCGVVILIAGLLLAFLTLLQFGIAALTGSVVFGYSGIASVLFVLPIAGILFVVGFVMSIIPAEPNKQDREQAEDRSTPDNPNHE